MMKLSALSLASLLIALQGQRSAAVLYGDEQFGNVDGGRFWVFNSNGVAIVNPDTCRVEQTVSSDSEGNLLPGSWFDGVYMEHCPEEEAETDDKPATKDCKQYVIINSAVTVTDTHGQDAGSGEVIFFDANTKTVASRVLVGPRPVHSYGVYTQNQYWTHADGDGFFYVVHLEDIDNHTGKPIKVKVNEANHGKLLWDESELLEDTGYATSTGEPHLFIIDMIKQEQIGTFDFSAQPGCFGSHSIAYAKANQHLYIECTGFGGVLELDVSFPRFPVLVKQHTDITGSIYEAPDESYVAVTDKGGNKFHLLRPGDTGVSSSVDYSLNVDGHPTGPVWYPNAKKGDVGATALDYSICLSLTVNTNKNHYNADGDLVCDFYSCSQAKTAEDVKSGICIYDTAGSGSALLQANITQIEDVKSGMAPYGLVCERCANENNYDIDEGLCTCTPDCGSCAADSKEYHDGDLSGAACLDLTGHVGQNAAKNGAIFVPAGGVKQGAPYSYSSECGFGRTYRPHKRGGIYDAISTDFPTPSLSLVDMRDFSLKCSVELPGSPYRIIYVPPLDGDSNSSSSSLLSNGAIAGLAVGGLAVLLLIVILSSMVLGRNKASNQKDDDVPNEQTPEVKVVEGAQLL